MESRSPFNFFVNLVSTFAGNIFPGSISKSSPSVDQLNEWQLNQTELVFEMKCGNKIHGIIQSVAFNQKSPSIIIKYNSLRLRIFLVRIISFQVRESVYMNEKTPPERGIYINIGKSIFFLNKHVLSQKLRYFANKNLDKMNINLEGCLTAEEFNIALNAIENEDKMRYMEFNDVITLYRVANKINQESLICDAANLIFEKMNKRNYEFLNLQADTCFYVQDFINNIETEMQSWVVRGNSLLALSMRKSFDLYPLDKIKESHDFYIYPSHSGKSLSSEYMKYYENDFARMVELLKICGCKINHLCIYDMEIYNLTKLFNYLTGDKNLKSLRLAWSSVYTKSLSNNNKDKYPDYYKGLNANGINTLCSMIKNTKSIEDISLETMIIDKEDLERIQKQVEINRASYRHGLLLFARENDPGSSVYKIPKDFFRPIANAAVSLKY